jgi:hypothetical protein
MTDVSSRVESPCYNSLASEQIEVSASGEATTNDDCEETLEGTFV